VAVSLQLITVNTFSQNWLSTADVQQKTENLLKINKLSSPNLMHFCCMHNYNFRTQYGMGLVQTTTNGYWRHFRFFRVVFVSLICLLHVFFRRAPVFVLLIIKFFRHSASYFLGKINLKMLSELF